MNRAQRFVCSMVVVCAAACIFYPAKSSAGDDWLPITPEDLALKDNPKSPGANAMILYRSSDVNAKDSETHEYVRIKIFTQEGTKEGNVELSFVKDVADIKDVHGRTIRPDGTVINFEGKVFEKEVVKMSGFKYLAKTFSLPDVHPGCIIEYQYRIQSDPSYYVNNKWTVTGHLYTREAKFTIKPDSSAYALPFTYREFGLPKGAAPQRQADGTYSMDVHDIAGLTDEEYMPPEATLEATVEFFYRSQDEPADDTPVKYWNRIGKKWSDQLDQFVNRKGALQSDLAQTISASDTPEVKLRKIYARVQKIRNLSQEDYKSDKEKKQEKLKDNANVEDVLKHNYAFGRDLNFTFVGLARAAAFEATEIYVAPRNSNLFFPEMMDAKQVGADVIWVRADGHEYYLDPAASSYPFGLLPWYETGAKGIRIGKQGAEIVNTPVSGAADATIVRTLTLNMDNEGVVSGKFQVDFTGQYAAARRQESHTSDDTGRRKTLGDEIKAWLPAGSEFEVTSIANWDDNTLPIHVEGTAKVPNLGTEAGHRMLIQLCPFAAAQAKAFEPEKRLNPIYFHFPYQEVDDVKLQVPSGYKIETLPPAKSVKPGAASYEISASEQGQTIEVKRRLSVDAVLFAPQTYPALRHFFNTVKTNDDAQIVLQSGESAKNN